MNPVSQEPAMPPAIQARLDRVDALEQTDYVSAIALGQEFLNVIANAFTTQIATLTACEKKINEAKAANSDRVMVPESILAKDLKKIAKGKQTCEYWKAQCMTVANKFQEFIVFMKEFHGKEKTPDFIKNLTILRPVFEEFDVIYETFLTAKKRAETKLISHSKAPLVYTYKAAQFPVNEKVYTQKVAKAIENQVIFDALTMPMLDMCSFSNLVNKSYSWLQANG